MDTGSRRLGIRGRFSRLLVLRIGYSYDIHNNLTGLTQTVNGVERISSYTYDDDNRVTSVTADGSTTYSYAYAANAGGRRGQFYYPHQQN